MMDEYQIVNGGHQTAAALHPVGSGIAKLVNHRNEILDVLRRKIIGKQQLLVVKGAYWQPFEKRIFFGIHRGLINDFFRRTV